MILNNDKQIEGISKLIFHAKNAKKILSSQKTDCR